MSGFDASVLNSPDTRLLVMAPNWLGDGIMVMPALQHLRASLHPQARLEVAARPNQMGLWRMHASPESVIEVQGNTASLPADARDLRRRAYTHAILIPNSFRSAIAPALAGIPNRRGTAGQLRRILINAPVTLSTLAARHQQWENAALLLPGDLPSELPPPKLSPPETARQTAADLLTAPAPRLGLIPGAARGPSKRWPGAHFQSVARAWLAHTGGSVHWLGTPEDAQICQALSAPLPAGASFNHAGKTSLNVFTALLESLDVVVANDSGGMHLAAAVGTRVVAVFGLTNPEKTGPLHPEAVVIRAAAVGDRRIARNSDAAQKALASVSPDRVIEPVLANFGPGA